MIARLALILCVVGPALVLWYAEWGVHGCDDSSGCTDRMDRDAIIALIGWGSITAAIVLVIVAIVRSRRR